MKVSTRTRFEVFKRDGFQCVYCGAVGEPFAPATAVQQAKYFHGILRSWREGKL